MTTRLGLWLSCAYCHGKPYQYRHRDGMPGACPMTWSGGHVETDSSVTWASLFIVAALFAVVILVVDAIDHWLSWTTGFRLLGASGWCFGIWSAYLLIEDRTKQ